MGNTDGRWSAKTPFPDLQVFLHSLDFTDTNSNSINGSNAAGIYYKSIASGLASSFILNPQLMLRSGVYATPPFDQEQYGTAASEPGPSTVAGTSGPLSIPGSGSPNFQGFPPIPAANLATLAGPYTGPLAKGIQIDSVDVIYQVLTAAATLAEIGLTKTNYANLVAPAVTNIITLGANGLPLVVGAEPQVTNVSVIQPASMIVAADTAVLLNIQLTAGSGGSINFIGAVLKAHYNLA